MFRKTYHKQIVILILLLSFTVHSQKASTMPLYLTSTYFNLKDSVKTIKFRDTFFRKGAKLDKMTYYLLRSINESPLYAFYPDGLLRLSINPRLTPDTIYKEINMKDKFISEYLYEKNEIASKKGKVNQKYYSAINNEYFFARTNVNTMYYQQSTDNVRTLTEQVYKYVFDEKNRAKEILEYFPNHEEGDTIPSGIIKKEDLWLRIVNYYNDKDLIISQKIFNGPKNNFDPVFQFSYESAGFCEDLELRYKYDNQNRMTQALLYGCKKTIMQEDYTYSETHDFVEQIAYFMNGDMATFVIPTKRFIKTFNPNGEVIETRYIPDYEGQSNPKMLPNYYIYEYDKHNNWIKCFMYLEGTKEGEPTMIAERQIEYYK